MSRSDVSCRDSIQRDSCVTGANAIASSDDGSGAASAFERTNRSRDGPGRDAREHRVPERGRRVGRRDRDLARPGAPLEVRRQRLPPRVGGLLPLGRRHRHLHQLLRLGERRRRHGRARAGARAERRRRAGRGRVDGLRLEGAAPSSRQAAAATRTPSGARIRNWRRVFMAASIVMMIAESVNGRVNA